MQIETAQPVQREDKPQERSDAKVVELQRIGGV
jgi:hypothetical protein